MTLAVASGRSLEREYIRDSEGQFADVPGVPNLGDKLKLAGRIQLGPGEKLLSSQRIRTRSDADGWDLMTAELETPSGRQVRLGIIYPDDSKHWTAGQDPKRSKRMAELDAEIDRLENAPELSDSESDRLEELESERTELQEFDAGNVNRTAVVDPASVAQMRADIDAGMERAKAWSKAWKELANEEDDVRFDSDLDADEQEERLARIEERFDALGDNDQYFLEGSIPGGAEGDLHYLVGGTDDGEGGWKIQLGIKPNVWDRAYDWHIGVDDDAARFEGSDVKKLLKALGELSDTSRSPESVNLSTLGVRFMPESRSLEALVLMSSSPAVRLMMYARTVEARRHAGLDVSGWNSANPLHPKGADGKFAKNAGTAAASSAGEGAKKAGRSAVAKAMASGDTSALDGFGREALRREARSREIDVPRGAHEDVIKDMLWDHEGSSKGGHADAPKAAHADMPSADSDWETHVKSGNMIPWSDAGTAARRSAARRAGRNAAPTKKVDTPNYAGPQTDLGKQLHAMSVEDPDSTDKARALISKMTLPQLKELAKDLGPTVRKNGTKKQMTDSIVEGTVGYRQRARAIGGWGQDHGWGQTSEVGDGSAELPTAAQVADKLDWLDKPKTSAPAARKAAAPKTPRPSADKPANPDGPRQVMGTSFSPNMRKAILAIEDSGGGLEQQRSDFKADYGLSGSEVDLLEREGFIEVDDTMFPGFVGLTPRGQRAFDELAKPPAAPPRNLGQRLANLEVATGTSPMPQVRRAGDSEDIARVNQINALLLTTTDRAERKRLRAERRRLSEPLMFGRK